MVYIEGVRKIIYVVVITLLLLTGCINNQTKPESKPSESTPPPLIQEDENKHGNGTLYYADDDIELSDEQEEIIVNYIDSYYQSLCELEIAEALTIDFDTEKPIHKLANELALDTLIKIRELQPMDLSLSEYEFELKVNAVDTKDDGDIQVRITENNKMRFTAYPEVLTENRNVWHYFMLTRVQNTWKIQKHVHADNIMRAMMDTYSEESIQDMDMDILCTQAKEVADKIYEDAQNQMSLRTDTARYNTDEPTQWDNDYDVKSALSYSKKWFGGRNPDWLEYDMYGGNCNNFISQCIYEGGIPMDTTGEHKWKWYADNINMSSSKLGRTPSWTGVDEFYGYAQGNRGRGLVSLVDADYFTGREGDILQMGFLDEWRHSVIITNVIRDEDGNIVDYLISSNTADQLNYPASAYAYTMQRLIKIYGWND